MHVSGGGLQDDVTSCNLVTVCRSAVSIRGCHCNYAPLLLSRTPQHREINVVDKESA